MKYLRYLLLLAFLGFFLVPISSHAFLDSVSVKTTFSPTVITYPTTTMNYTATVTITDETAVHTLCGSSDIFVYITPAATGQTFKESDFLISKTKTVQGSFVENPQSQFSITYTTEVKCGSGYNQVLAQTTNTLQTQGQPSGGGAVGVTFDATPTAMNGSSGAFNFKLSFNGKQADLDNTCGAGKNMIWTIYQTAVPNQLGDATEVLRGAIPQTNFGTGKTIAISPDPSATVSNPGHNFYFQARATCDGSTTPLTTSGPAPAAGVSVSGGTGGGGGPGGTTAGQEWACIAGDNKYACSPGNKQDLSDVPNGACTGKAPVQIDSSDCSTIAAWSCIDNSGRYACSKSNDPKLADQPLCTGRTSTAPPAQIPTSHCGQFPGGGSTYSYSITNPLNGGPTNPFDLINIVSQWLFNISIPLAVMFILYAGFLMLTAGPNPTKVKQARSIITNVVLALAIIFIGRGFVSLIRSVIELGGQSTPSATANVVNGGACTQTSNCASGLICNNNNSICQPSTGNVAGGPCVSDANCATGMFCDTSPAGQQTVAGRSIFTCQKAAPAQ